MFKVSSCSHNLVGHGDVDEDTVRFLSKWLMNNPNPEHAHSDRNGNGDFGDEQMGAFRTQKESLQLQVCMCAHS